MKNILSHIGVSAAALFLFGVLPSQAQIVAKADIPFAFHSSLAAYDGGTYTVRLLSGNNMPLVLVKDGGSATFVPTSSSLDVTDRAIARGPVMIFKCDGACYLTEVWTASKGYAIPHRNFSEEASTTKIVALVRAAR